MTPAWEAQLEGLGDRLNPIIVKEVRQGLRTRVFWVAFGLMLLACFIISLVAYGSSLDGALAASGQAFFFAYFVCLGAVHFFLIPYSAYRSLAREREDETWILLSLTGIGAKRIIRGKMGSFLAQAMLYASAVLPFLLFSYYLNGIDLPTILTVTALGGAYMVFLTCVAACAATLADSRLIRGLVHFVVLGVLLSGTVLGLTLAGGLTFDASLRRDADFAVVVGAVLWAMVSYGYVMYQAASARLSLPTEDAARGPRVAVLGQLLGSAAIAFGIWYTEGRAHEVVLIGGLMLLANLFPTGVFLVGGSDAVHEIHYRRPGWPWLRPGPVRALRFVTLLVGGTMAAFSTLFVLSDDLVARKAEPRLWMILAGGSYVLLYLTAPIVIARLGNSPKLRTAMGLRLITLVLVTLAIGGPPLLALLLGLEPDHVSLNVFNPIVGLMNFAHGPPPLDPDPRLRHLLVVATAALAMTVFADRLLSSHERRSREQRTRGGP